jgi:hypothetical protein
VVRRAQGRSAATRTGSRCSLVVALRHDAHLDAVDAARLEGERRVADKLGLSERDAVSAMTAALREKGVDAAKIPDPGGKSLTEWVEALLERVSGAVVMGAAQRIARR